MSANFTPSLNVYTDLTPFRFWCQKVLPLAYDDSLSYYELLCKVVDYLNKTMEDVSLSIEDVEKLHAAYVSLQGYVNNYFNNLDVQEEINNKLDALVADGTIHEIFTPDVTAILNVARQASLDAIAAIPGEVTDWLDDNISQETGYVIDNTLTVSGAAADAKVTGGRLSALKSDLDYSAMIDDTLQSRICDNLIKFEGIVYGAYVRRTDGAQITSADWCYTKFLPVTGGKKYYFSTSNNFICWYTDDNFSDFISGAVTSPNGVTAPNNAAYCVVSLPISIFSSQWMCEGDSLIIYGSKSDNDIKGIIADYDNMIGKIENNLINLLSITDGYIVWANSSGKPSINHPTYCYSDFIPVEGDADYYCSINGLFLNWYTSNDFNSYISTVITPADFNTPRTAPSNAAYAVLSMNQAVKGNVILSKNEKPKNYGKIAYNKVIDATIPKTYHVGSGQTYTTLRAGISAAIAEGADNIVVVHPGTYDLTQEFSTEISAATGVVGIALSNNVYVKFLSGAYVKAIFNESSDWISTYFNPFYGRNFTLDGLDLEVANCRYGVHDEQSGADVTYHNVYKNCVMKNTTSRDSGVTGNLYPQCIGGGLGKYGYIEIIGGKYTSTGVRDGADEIPCISYHNGNIAGADSKIFIRDVYLDGDDGNFRFGYYGPSTIESQVMISGCSMGSAIIHRAETASSVNDNFDIIEWNNIIRSI